MPEKVKRRRRRPADDANASQRRELVFFLADEGGFRLGLATYDAGQTRDREIERLRRELAADAVDLTCLDLSTTPHELFLRQRLAQHLAEHPPAAGRRPAVMVLGLEATLDYGSPDEGLAVLENANFERDSFAGLGPVSVVLWLDETASVTFMKRAPDLWHWRYGSFTFRDPSAPRPDFRRFIGQLWSPSRPSGGEPVTRLGFLNRLLEQLGEDDSELARTRRGDLLNDLGWTHLELGDTRQAEKLFQEAVKLSRKSGERREAVALGNWGRVRRQRGEPHLAEDCHFQALGIARRTGDRKLENELLAELGVDAYLGQRVDRAILYFEEAHELARELDDGWRAAGALANLALAQADRGRSEEAWELAERALAGFRDHDDRRGEAAVLANLGLVYGRLDRLDEAILNVARALAIHRDLDEPFALVADLRNLARLHDAVGQPGKAETVRAEADEIAHELPGLVSLRLIPPVSGEASAEERRETIAIVVASRDNSPMARSKSRFAQAAQTYLHDLMSREGLSPADIEHRAGWKPGQFAERLAAWSEAIDEYGEILNLIMSSSTAQPGSGPSEKLPPSYADPSPYPLPAPPVSEIREPGSQAAELDAEALFLDLILTGALLDVQAGKRSGAAMYLRLRDWMKTYRPAGSLYGDDEDPLPS